jgi:hypothetical protein
MTNSLKPEFSKSILVDLVLMCGRVEDKTLRHEIQSISKQIRFSEPAVYPGHEVLDQQIRMAHMKLINLIDFDETEQAIQQVILLKSLFTQRDELVAQVQK